MRKFAAALLGASIACFASGAVADQLAVIKDDGKIVFRAQARYPPFEFVEDGRMVGYSTNLLELVMKSLPGVKSERLDLP